MKKQMILRIIALIIIDLFICLPAAFALSISDVQISANDEFANIKYNTDQEADTLINYGTNKTNLDKQISYAGLVENHSITLTELEKSTEYFFEMQSSNATETILDNNSNEFYSFTTLAEDTTPPFIDSDVPEFIRTPRLDIEGTTEPFSRVNIYEGSTRIRTSDPNKEGTFRLLNIELESEEINTFRLEAVDHAGNTNSTTINVQVDLIAPEIEITQLPSASAEPSVPIKGTVSEESIIQINVDDITQESTAGTSFESTLSLEEGTHTVEVVAVDAAGNRETASRTVFVDTQPIRIEDIRPERGAFFYEGNTETDIEGQTKANAQVELYFGEVEGEPDIVTTSDSGGYFKFSEVELEEFDFEAPEADAGDTGFGTGPEEVEEQAEIPPEAAGAKPDTITAVVYIVVRDAVGRTKQERLTYPIGTCYSGGMNWNIQSIVDYQSPTLLSPERLEQGTELISFVLNLSYQGHGEQPVIKRVIFEKACRGKLLEDDIRYNVSCKVMPTQATVRSNDDKTMWYVRFNLNKMEGLTDFSDDVLEDLTNEVRFPLRVKIEYTHEVDGKEITDLPLQVSCLDFAYAMDTSRIDPRDVLPDWLLVDGVEAINETLKQLDQIIPQVEQVLKYSAIACLASFLLRTFTLIARRFACGAEIISDKASGEDDDTKCTKSLQYNYNNIEGFEKACPSCDNMWNWEERANKAFRWACDRVLCHKSPAGWTAEADTDKIGAELKRAQTCAAEEDMEKTMILHKGNEEIRYKGRPYKGYYYYEKNEYVDVKETDNTVRLEKVYGGIEGPSYINAEYVDRNTVSIPKEELQRIRENPDLPTEEEIIGNTCESVGGSVTVKDLGEDHDFNVIGVDERKSDGEDYEKEYNYRLEKLGVVCYNENRYWKERDFPACFGQNNFIFRDTPMLTPSQHTSAIQCLCISGIRNRLVLLRSILEGFLGCLNQIKTTGKANAGICKEMFTQYLCVLIFRLIKALQEGCIPMFGEELDLGEGVGSYTTLGADSIWGGVTESADDLRGEYENAALENYLGVSEGTLARKICLGALTGDWGMDLEGLMDVAYSTAFNTHVSAWPADREYLTWNPDNFQSTYEYRVAYNILAGCDIDSYTVHLACVGADEQGKPGVDCSKVRDKNNLQGCDCLVSGHAEKTFPLDNGRNVDAGAVVDQSVHKSVEGLTRYDHVKVKLNIHDSTTREQCLPDGNEDGIFYFPIQDATVQDILACRFDQTTGEFLCDQGGLLWNKRGSAFFREVECNGKPCEQRRYYVKESIKLDPLSVTAKDKKQCLWVQIENQRGQKLLREGGETWAIPVGDTGTATINTPKELIENIEPEMLGSTAATYYIEPRETFRGSVDSADLGEYANEGTNTVYFVDNNKDGFANKVIVKDKNNQFKEFSLNSVDMYGGSEFRFATVNIPSKGRCNDLNSYNGDDYKDKPCQKFTFRFVPEEAVPINNPQTWEIKLELRHAPGEENEGFCRNSIPEDLITVDGQKQEKEYSITINPGKRSEAEGCKPDGDVDHQNLERCDCNEDGNLEEDVDFIDINKKTEDDSINYISDDCTGGSGSPKSHTWYCYESSFDNGQKKSQCHAYPQCRGLVDPPKTKENIEEEAQEPACDCNEDGLVQKEGLGCEGTGKNFCNWKTGKCVDKLDDVPLYVTTASITNVRIVNEEGNIVQQIEQAEEIKFTLRANVNVEDGVQVSAFTYPVKESQVETMSNRLAMQKDNGEYMVNYRLSNYDPGKYKLKIFVSKDGKDLASKEIGIEVIEPEDIIPS
ncbi:hypothetical protein GF336_01710 [Candidatus Woesearchaeota archaeon]|nr:hypothetical protein [Candidatus Woesearchaeota archaeon]